MTNFPTIRDSRYNVIQWQRLPNGDYSPTRGAYRIKPTANGWTIIATDNGYILESYRKLADAKAAVVAMIPGAS